ncbi:MAG: flagellar hook-basal body complex protein FliE [Desulfobacteraceae bacterium]|nr:MAG: flagellar hook-basal body complex protein FliE [Desulfobacteraceae bacterium]
MSILSIDPIGSAAAPAGAAAAQKRTPAQPGFGQWLAQSLSEVDRLQQVSDQAAQKLISGENKDIHGTMIAMQKAGVALDLVMEIRNKIISAYEEVKRMQF